jgi:hypothetical protein
VPLSCSYVHVLYITYLQDATKIVHTNVNPAGIPEEIISHFPFAATLPTDNTAIIQLLNITAIERHDGVTSLTHAPKS